MCSTTKEQLQKLAKEIRAKYNSWDENIKAGQQPVPIQDLDFWATKLEEIIGGLVK